MLSRDRAWSGSESADVLASTRTNDAPALVLVEGDTTNNVAPTEAEAARESFWPLLPWPRGPLSATVISALKRQPGTLGGVGG
jgi:hypothetical protein